MNNNEYMSSQAYQDDDEEEKVIDDKYSAAVDDVDMNTRVGQTEIRGALPVNVSLNWLTQI